MILLLFPILIPLLIVQALIPGLLIILYLAGGWIIAIPVLSILIIKQIYEDVVGKIRLKEEIKVLNTKNPFGIFFKHHPNTMPTMSQYLSLEKNESIWDKRLKYLESL